MKTSGGDYDPDVPREIYVMAKTNMTSRRQFLGLLAAAPVVGPEMVKAAVQEAPHVSKFREFVLRGDHGPTGIPGHYAAYVRYAEPENYISKFTNFDISVDPPVDWLPPNRLHGSYINADGDAT